MKSRVFNSLLRSGGLGGLAVPSLCLYRGIRGINGFAVTFLAPNWPPGVGYLWLCMGDLDLSVHMIFPRVSLRLFGAVGRERS